MPPLPGSPAIDHGSNALIPAGTTTDQRGFSRIVNGTVDIGSVETESAGTLSYSQPAAQEAVEARAMSFSLGSLSETPAKGPFTCNVNWGDGSDSILTINATGALQAMHEFTQTGDLTGMVTLTDNAGSFVIGAPFAIDVAAATLSGSALPSTFAAGVRFARVLATSPKTIRWGS